MTKTFACAYYCDAWSQFYKNATKVLVLELYDLVTVGDRDLKSYFLLKEPNPGFLFLTRGT